MARFWLAVVAALALGGAVASADVAEPDCTIEGTDRAQIIRGTAGPDVICALGGNDVIYGEGGDDVVRGGSGNDTIYAEAGADRMEGGPGHDRLLGGTGKDRFLGGDGTDLADYSPQVGAVRVTLGNGVADDGLNGGREQDDVAADIEGVRGGGGADDLTGGPGDDLLSGGGGADILRGGAGADRLVGGAGGDAFFGGASPDIADYSAAAAPVTASIGDGPNDGTSGEGDDVRGDVEYLRGGPYGDTLTGDGLPNILYGGAGDDELHGGGGRDQLLGGLGADELDGGPGGDLATYADLVTGGVKVTVGDAASGDGRDAGAEGDDVGASVERVIGTRFADDLTAAPGGSAISGYLGADTLRGGAGADVLDGADGDDEVSGGGGIDAISGGLGNDTLLARDGGFDQVHCGTGSDGHDSEGGDAVDASCETRRAFAADDTAGTDEDTPVTVDVLANDVGDAIGVTSATTAATSLVAGGVKFTPDGYDHLAAGDTDSASFDYTIAGAAGTDTGSVSVAIAGVNDAPTVAHGAAAGYAEGAGATAIDPAVSVADIDDGDELESASVAIKSPRTGDALAMTDTAHIAGAFAGGVLTLTPTGAPSEAEWSEALGNVTFASSSDDPGTSRSFDFKVADGTAETISTRSMAITGSNDAPVVDAGPDGGSMVGDGPQAAAGALTVSDADSTKLTGATITVDEGHQDGDVLSYDPAGNTAISRVSSPQDDQLVLTGDDTVESYEAALRRVTHDALSGTAGKRTLAVTVTDTGGLTASDSRDFTVEARGPRVRNLETAPLAYTENGAPEALSQTLTLEDPFASGVQSATVEITGGRQPGDELDASAVSGLTATPSPDKSTVTLTGAGTLADYAAAMRAVAYRTTSDDPSTSDRTVAFTWTDSNARTSPAATRTIEVTAANDAPQAGDDSFGGAIGNTKLAVSTPDAAGPAKHITGTVLAGDSDPDGGDTLTASSADPDVSMSPDGTFTYLPPAGEEASDMFAYTVSDGHGGTDTGTVTITIDHPAVWYVDAAAPAGGDGRSSKPFDSVASVSADADADDNGDLIFLYSGAGAGATYPDGLVLERGQQVRAQPGELTVGGTTLIPGDATLGPASLAPPSATALVLADSADVRDVRVVGAAGGTAVSASGVDTARIEGAAIAGGQGGTAVRIFAGGGTIRIDAPISGGRVSVEGRSAGSVSFTDPDASLTGVESLSNASGHIVTLAGAKIDGGTQSAVQASGGMLRILAGGAREIRTSSGTVVDVVGGAGLITIAPDLATATGRLVSVRQRQGDEVILSGSLSDTDTSQGILVEDNHNTAVSFTGAAKEIDTGTAHAVSVRANTGTSKVTFGGGGLDARSAGGMAFRADAGGEIAVAGAGNKLAAEGGEGLHVGDTTIGAAGLTFERIDATGAANGIYLKSTGSAGGLQVTGNGSPGSGGRLGGSPQATTTAGVWLESAGGVALEDMLLDGAWNYGILGIGARDLALSGSTVQESTWGNVLLHNHTGSATLTGSAFDAPAEDNVSIGGSATGNLDVTFDDNTVDCTTGTAFGEGLQIAGGSGGDTTAVVSDSELLCAGAELFEATSQARGSVVLNMVRNTLHNRMLVGRQTTNAAGIRLRAFNTSADEWMTFRLADNTVAGTRDSAIEVTGSRSGSYHGSVSGTIVRNTIGRAGVDFSGSKAGDGIRLKDLESAEYDLRVHDNTVLQVARHGISFESGNLNGVAVSPDVTISNNVAQERPTAPLPDSSGLWIQAGSPGGTAAFTACVDALGNDFSSYGTSDAADGSDLRVAVGGNGTMRLPGYTGASFGSAADTGVASRLIAQNPTRPASTAYATVSSGSSVAGGAAACEQPPALPSVP